PKNIFLPLIALLVFKVISTIYITTGMKLGLSVDEIARIPHLMMSSREDLEALIATHGKIIGIIFICLIGPLYEEIIFRGVVLDSCHKYLNFNLANTIQSTLFATIHMSLFMFPLFFVFGFITGILRKKSDGLLPGIIFHVVNNAIAIGVLLEQMG
ncbi:MAG TPA: CPBP family intramembrane glutamic endopeptidase, partial [Bacteroidales bacterium]|nr:CPBP family intramembrane glutamic endopeptidase [Bacteroidales bacterium]